MTLLAHCPDCSKSYRVPHARKPWTCKLCATTLVLDAPTETDCPACGAVYFGEESFCGECGESLSATPPSQEDKREDRRQAAEDLRRAVRRVSRLKGWITFNLVVTIFSTLVFSIYWLITDMDPGLRILMLVVQGALLTLAILARVFFDRRPFPIIVTLASIQTLLVLWKLTAGEPWIPGVGWAAILWMLSAEAAQVARITRQHPDLYLAKRMRGEHLTHRGKPAREESGAQRRIRIDRERSSRKLWTRIAVAAGVLLVSLVGLAAYTVATAPPSPDEAIERFQVAWNAADLPAVVAESTTSWQPKLQRSLDNVMKRYEWGDQLPPIEVLNKTQPQSDSVHVAFVGEGGPVHARFKYQEGRWRLSALDLKNVKHWRPDQ